MTRGRPTNPVRVARPGAAAEAGTAVTLLRTIQRAQAAWASTPVAVLLLVLANLLPLAGVLFLGWELMTILVLYWVENGIVGLFNVARIRLASGAETDLRPSSNLRASIRGPAGKAYLMSFFFVHYGLFWAVHGVFVFVLVSIASGDALPLADLSLAGVVVGGLALTLSHGASFATNYIGRGEYRRISPAAQFSQPYARMVVLHVTILVGAWFIFELGQPLLLLVFMVLLKIALDLLLHLRQHGRLQAPAAPAD
jgi:hypothetical protein